ncbi:MAG: hypothetical protein H0W84_12935 [Bacteroidetes bacterium]|nr:hypothetical protein [Bacteroidota bacterium]
MKKLIYIVFALSLSFTGQLYSQSRSKQCFSLEKNTNGKIEKTYVIIFTDGKTVEADVQKELTQANNSYSRSWEMEGSIERETITFIVPQGTVDVFKNDQNPIHGPKPIEKWTFKSDQLIIDENVFKAVNCK